LIVGLAPPDDGEIEVARHLLTPRSAEKLRRLMGYVIQEGGLFPHLTARGNIELMAREMAWPVERRAARLEELLQLTRFPAEALERFPAELSGGQRQRVALMRALMLDPEVLLMDEPLGALDKQLRERMQLEIKHIHEELGITVVFVTHDQSEALTMSDRIAVFNHGVIQQIDSPTALYEKPANNFVANFIGENNALDGTVESLHGETCQVRLDNGARVQASIGNVVKPGSRAVLSVRPECVQLNAQSLGCANRLGGYVKEIIYLGDHLRVRVELAGRKELVIKAPAAQHKHRFDMGDAIHVGINPEQLLALDPGVAA
jgi:putative spermidine/putrescine transport system ATP-binding protein